MSFLKLLRRSRFLIYCVIVALVFGIDFAIYSALVLADFSIYLANIVAFLVGTTINVLLIRRFVITRNRFELSTDLVVSMAVYTAMMLFGLGLLWLFVEGAGINVYAAKLVSNGITFLANYAVRLRFFSRA